MAFVITDTCLGERYATCAGVCPVDCIYPGEYQGQVFMVIDPDICIDCGLCLTECPLGAIVDAPGNDPEWAGINRQLAPEFSRNPPAPTRPRNDPPRVPGHVIVNP